MERHKNSAVIVGLLAAVVLGLLMYSRGCSSATCWTASVTLLCAIWWTTEAIPLPATALIPMAVLPFAGVITHQQAAAAYGDSLILLMLAGSIIATALEKSEAHLQVAMLMVRLLGGADCRRLVMSFLVTSALLSMWLSNTATVVLLLPVALALIHASTDKQLAAPLLLAITYGASVGGTATPVGTPPNLIMIRLYHEASEVQIGFAQWMRVGLPIMLLMLPAVWLCLTRKLQGQTQWQLPPRQKWTTAQKRTLLVFALTALAWLTRTEPFGGWGAVLNVTQYVGDSSVALLAAVVMFVIPSGDESRSRLLDWTSAEKIPWGVFIMIGGGMAIGSAFEASKLDQQLTESLAHFANLPTWAMVVGVCLICTFTTEITSNTAIANVLLPIVIGVARAANIDPLVLLFPATFALNWSFMLPVGTAPNAIVFGTGMVSTRTMIRYGLLLNLIGTLIISAVCLFTLHR